MLVKAAAGGGGKGMRVVRSADDYAEAYAAAQREARSAFGDDTILVEKYVQSGRHIEVQVLGDAHGHVLHFFERDCSTQRRHQKVLEEAPAPTIDDAQRAAITSSAVALSQQCGYTGAGTVEFLLDNVTGEFYFLEMNTRLQVEHPVTEEVVRVEGRPDGGRVDLVELQLLVATGEPLPFGQDAITLEGHAIEARVYAEDSFNGFLPQAGRTSIVRWGSGQGVRVDHALEPEQEVSTSYDPMLGKVIAWGTDREAARAALVAALDDTAILGITTNTGFLRALAASDEFRDTSIDTAWLDDHEVPAPDAGLARVFAAWTEVLLDTMPGQVAPAARGTRTAGGWGPTPRPTPWSWATTSWSSTGTGDASSTTARATTYAWCPRPTTRSASSSTAGPTTPCSTCSATSSRSCTTDSAGRGSVPTPSPTTPPLPATARCSHRCPAPSSRSTSPRARPWSRVRRWA